MLVQTMQTKINIIAEYLNCLQRIFSNRWIDKVYFTYIWSYLKLVSASRSFTRKPRNFSGNSGILPYTAKFLRKFSEFCRKLQNFSRQSEFVRKLWNFLEQRSLTENLEIFPGTPDFIRKIRLILEFPETLRFFQKRRILYKVNKILPRLFEFFFVILKG